MRKSRDRAVKGGQGAKAPKFTLEDLPGDAQSGSFLHQSVRPSIYPSLVRLVNFLWQSAWDTGIIPSGGQGEFRGGVHGQVS